MRTLIDRCPGIDVGQALLVVPVRVVNGKGKLTQEIRSFGATTPDLLELRDCFAASEVTHVAMESTGVYWKAPLVHAGGRVRAAAGQRVRGGLRGGHHRQKRSEIARVLTDLHGHDDLVGGTATWAL